MLFQRFCGPIWATKQRFNVARSIRTNPKYLWSRKVYILKLLWIHPEWLRAVVALLIVIPLFLVTTLGLGLLILFVPLVLCIKFLGLGWGLIFWSLLYGYASTRFVKLLRHQHRNRPRRRPHHIRAK